MKKMTLLVTVIFISMLLTACMTTMLWNENSATHTTKEFNTLKEDQVSGFAKVVQKDLSTNFLVIGIDNAYLIEDGSEDINQLLLLGAKNTSIEMLYRQDQALVLDVDSKNKSNYMFNANLAFRFSVKNPTTEQKELFKAQSERFKTKLVEKDNELSLIRYIPIKGKIIMLNDEMKSTKLQNMSKSYKVKVGYYEVRRSWHKFSLIDNIIQTPFALVADAIIIPFAVVGIAVGSVTK